MYCDGIGYPYYKYTLIINTGASPRPFIIRVTRLYRCMRGLVAFTGGGPRADGGCAGVPSAAAPRESHSAPQAHPQPQAADLVPEVV